LKQDEITLLEEALDSTDSNEECELFLGCKRRDQNPARQRVIEQLKTCLAEYGASSCTTKFHDMANEIIEISWWSKAIEYYPSQNPVTEIFRV
jgi:hypothetical protein